MSAEGDLGKFPSLPCLLPWVIDPRSTNCLRRKRGNVCLGVKHTPWVWASYRRLLPPVVLLCLQFCVPGWNSVGRMRDTANRTRLSSDGRHLSQGRKETESTVMGGKILSPPPEGDKRTGGLREGRRHLW